MTVFVIAGLLMAVATLSLAYFHARSEVIELKLQQHEMDDILHSLQSIERMLNTIGTLVEQTAIKVSEQRDADRK